MISGVVAFERLHATLDGLQNAHPFVLTSGNLAAHTAVDLDGGYELVSSPRLQDTVKSATDVKYALQHQYLSLKKEGGVQLWRVSDLSSSRGAPVSRQWPVGEIAAADGASAEIVIDQGGQIGSSGSLEADASVGSVLQSAGGDSNEWFKFDLTESIKDLGRQAEILKEQVTSLDYSISPTPFTPVEGPEAVKFGVVSVGLLFIWWLGNYFVPDLIFKDTVFKKDPEESVDPSGKSSEDNILTPSDQEKSPKGSSDKESPKGSSEALKTSKGAGFSRGTKKKRAKSGKRK